MRCLEDTLSYAALSERSNKLARTLYKLGVRRSDRVGIFLHKCIEIPVALHGIMKAGAAYVPLDTAAPTERLVEIIRDCGIRHLVTADDNCAVVAKLSEMTEIDSVIGVNASTPLGTGITIIPWTEVDAADGATTPRIKILESDLAYIMYTSGSTGRPKGIMHTHHSSLSFSRWAAHEYKLQPDDVLSNHAPLHFDLSILDFFSGAVAGCSTSIIPEEYTKLPASYCKLIADHGITVLYTVPFALVQLLLRGSIEKHDLSRLRWAIFGGEPFPLKHLRELMRRLPHVRFDNIYGPAEVNGVTHYTVEPIAENADAIPIGPLARSAEGLIADEHDEPVAQGDIGELLVRTPTMMQGYWARDDLNAHAFYTRRRIDGVDETFYRTGDLVREDGRGMLWFLGRKDRQVKVRGYRVELDEVEAAMVIANNVEEAAAIAIPAVEGSQRIIAMVTLKPGTDESALESLVRHARATLPAYATPSEIAIREAFPRTTTGKIDRKSLRDEALFSAAQTSEQRGPRA